MSAEDERRHIVIMNGKFHLSVCQSEIPLNQAALVPHRHITPFFTAFGNQMIPGPISPPYEGNSSVSGEGGSTSAGQLIMNSVGGCTL